MKHKTILIRLKKRLKLLTMKSIYCMIFFVADFLIELLFHSSSVVETSITSTESATSNTEAYTSMNVLEDAGVRHRGTSF